MALYWDQCQVNITNNTTSPMTYSSSSTSDGFLIDNPGNIGAGPGATGSFKGSSSSGNASDGCAGTVTYSLTDGTLVNVNYKTSYYYGPSNNSSYTARAADEQALVALQTASEQEAKCARRNGVRNHI